MSLLKHSLAPDQQCDGPEETVQHPSDLHGLYMLTRAGNLARMDAHGRPVVEQNPDAALRDHVSAVLRDYRDGKLDGVNLGLVAEAGAEPRKDAATMIFSDWVLNELFDTGRLPGMPLTLYEHRNRFKSVFQGMEILLNKERPPSLPCPHYCPVLVEPRVGLDVLCERYDVELTEDVALFEVLDLSAPATAPARVRDDLMRMIWEMRAMQMPAPPADLNEAGRHDDTEASSRNVSLPAAILAMSTRMLIDIPLAPAPETCFEDGDPVSGWLLEWFTPFNELTDTQRDIIAGYETIRKVRAGTTLIERGSRDETCIYLVEGTLALTATNGSTMRVSGGTRRSRLPISVLSPHAFDVAAATDVSVIVFNSRLIDKINEITRTYTSVESGHGPKPATAQISNGAQAVYLRHAGVK